MKILHAPTEFKAVGDAGRFEGYASVFGNIDLGGDVIERGAFKEFVKNGDGKVVVLWMHRQDSPLGVAEITQDDKGLHFAGDLVLDDPQARKIHAHMKAGSVRGMSIGYDVLAGGAEMMTSGVRRLKALKLWEVSVVTFGMNPLAGVLDVKTAEDITIREFETLLRDVGGFTQSQAKAIAADGFKALRQTRDVSAGADVAKILADTADIFSGVWK